MSRKIVTGVLEHVIFELKKKKIKYELKELGMENGFPEQQIILRIEEKELFVYIVKHEKKVTYSISEKGQKRKNVSKLTLLEKIKGL